MTRLAFFSCLLIWTTAGLAQKDRTLFFGINVGAKIANKNYAGRYNGAYPYTTLEASELYMALNTPYNYDQLYQSFGDKHFALTYDSYPANIRYTPGVITGVTAGYQVSPNFQMSIDANFCKLKIKDAFTVEVYDPGNFTSEPVIEVGNLYAEEGRFDGRYNIDYVFDGSGKARFMTGISGLFNAWRIEQQMATLNGYQMALFSVHNPANNFLIVTRGMGWGGGLNIGVDYRINNKMVAQLLYQPYQTKVNYGFNITKRLLIQHDITLRILWK